MLVPAPTAAAPLERADRQEVAAEPGQTEATHREIIAFGKWVLELDRALEPAITAVREMGPEWQKAMQAGSPAKAEAAFLPFVARADAAIAESRRRMTALPAPQFPLMNLPPESSPESLRAEMTQMVDQMAEVAGTFAPMLKALTSNNPAAAEQAVGRMLTSVRTLYRAQAVMTGAWLATLEEDEPAHYSMTFDLYFYRSGGRLLGAAEAILMRRQDKGLAADLRRSADEMDRAIDNGLAAVDAQNEEMQELIDESGSDAEAVSARAMLNKVIAINGLYRESFALSRAFTRTVRATADGVGTAPVTMATLNPMVQALPATRAQLDGIATQQAEIMAGMR